MACVVLAVALIAVLAAHLAATRQWAAERRDLLREHRHLTNLVATRSPAEAALVERAQATADRTPTPATTGEPAVALAWD